MKALLTFVASLFCVVGVNAASPSFSSFYTNHFTTNNLVIKAKLNTNQFDTSTSSTNITITITNVSGVGGLLWTNDTSIGSSGRLMPIPGLDYAYVYPSNFYNHGWFTLQPEFHLLGSGTNTIGVEESSHLMFSMTNDPTEVIITLEAGFAMGQELLLMSYTNTVFNGRFTLPADSVVSGGGFVKLNNNEDWLGENGAAIRLIWIEPDWWEQGRWTAGSNVTADVIWANVAGVIQPRGGQITNALQFISGSADAATNTLLTLDTVNVWTTDNSKLLDLRSVGTNVAYVTPSGSFESGRNVLWGFPSRDDILVGVHDASLGESSYAVIYTAAIDGNTETNYSDFGVTLNTGASPASTMTMASVATNLVSSFNILLQPDQNVGRIELMVTNGLVWKVDDNGGMYVGPNSYTLLGPNNNALSVFRDVSLGDVPNTGMSLYARMTNGQGIGTYDLTIGTNSSFLAVGWNDGPSPGRGINFTASSTETTLDMASLDGVRRVSFAPSTADGANATAHWLDTDTTWDEGLLLGIRNNSTNMLSIGHLGQVTWGPGRTNVAFRNVNDLVYTNGGNSVNFEVRKGDGASVKLGLSTGSHGQVIAGTGSDFYVGVNNNGSGDFVFTGSSFASTADGLDDLGSTVNQWNNFYLDNSIFFGPGLTNVLSRSGERLRYANESASGSVYFEVKGSHANTARYGVNSNGDAALAVESGKVLFLTPNGAASGSIVVQAAGILPDTDDQFDLGADSSNGAFQDLYMKGVAYVQGANDGVGNKTRLEVEHTGNAGNIEYRSTALGTQTFRPHVFMVGSTNVAKFDTTSAATETRFWIYDEDNGTMERVTVGAPDSGGVGFKVLRIPN